MVQTGLFGNGGNKITETTVRQQQQQQQDGSGSNSDSANWDMW